jgi:hypothetical protein
LARAYDWLTGLRRHERHRLQRRWQMSLAMLALLIAMSGMPIPAHAAGAMTVTANVGLGAGGCSLAK